MIKYGFQIVNGEIYDTKIQSYKIVSESMGENILYSMKPNKYKRLYRFEPLLEYFPIDTVFELLNFNSHLRKQRASENLVKTNKLHYVSNMATIYNYPPTFLTQRRFALYKICQNLKKRLD